MPKSERDRRLQEICSAALKRDASLRNDFLREACGDDAVLRNEAKSLLEYARKLDGFLETPALQKAAFAALVGVGGSLVGQTLGPYTVLSLLGAGGMGKVYAARDTRLGRLVALKTLHPDMAADPERKGRLLLEAQAASALNDPRIVVLHDVGAADGIDFLVMEYVEGQTLDALMASGGIDVQQTLAYAVAVAGAVATAHKAGIIHRDLKPGNIMITSAGAVKVLDFGLAKLTEAPQARAVEGAGSLMSMAGLIMGTAAYMSPEQAQGQRVDARSDIFSFGVVLYEMLAGQRPFQGSDRTSTLAAIVRQEPKQLGDLNPKIPAELGRVVLRCLRKDPSERFQDLADVQAALEGLQQAKSAATRSRWIGSAALVAILIAGVETYQWMRNRSERGAARNLPERQLTDNTPENRLWAAAISPDGKYLAYHDRIGLFLRSLDFGESRPVRKPPELLYKPVSTLQWSPDGGKLLADPWTQAIWAFPLRPAIWAFPVHGEEPPRTIYPLGLDPVIAPDGKSIAFISSSRQELWVGGINGESPRKLADRGEKDSFFHPAWSPDGRWIAYWNIKGWPRTITIEVRPASGGGPAKTLVPGSKLPTTVWTGSGSMVWSPDWRLIFALNEASEGIDADFDNDGIWDIRVEPTQCEPRSKPERLTPLLGWFLRNMTITADGKRLAFLKARSQWDVWVSDLEKGGTRMGAPHRLTFDVRGSFLYGWTLDSHAILYGSRLNGKTEIFRHPLTFGGAPPEVFVARSEGVCCATPTPDGLWLLYVEGVRGAPALRRLMRQPVSGGPPEMVLERSAAEGVDFNCPEAPGHPCVLQQKQGQEMVFYAFDPVGGKGERIGQFEIQGSPSIGWGLSRDGSRLGVVASGQLRISVLTLADRAWHDIEVPSSWGWLTEAVGPAAGLADLTVIAASTNYFDFLNVSPTGKLDHLFREDWSEPQPSNPQVSPDGKHLAFKTWTLDSNAWMIENF